MCACTEHQGMLEMAGIPKPATSVRLQGSYTVEVFQWIFNPIVDSNERGSTNKDSQRGLL